MFPLFKKLFYAVSFNSCLFLMLIVGIQNSSEKSKINFFNNETVKLPIGFILGTSFISGSFIGSFIKINFDKKPEL